MPTRTDNIFKIRSLLNEPLPNTPNFNALLRQELSEEADILNASNNTGVPWAVETTQLNYYPGQASYDLNVSNFGKPYLVTRIVNSPYIHRINVRFDDLNNQQYGTIWNTYGAFAGLPWAFKDAPEKISFFREGVLNSQYRVTIQPQPQQFCVYEITYIPGYLSDDDPLQSAIQMPEHATLVQLRAAMALLPYCKWSDDIKADTLMKQQLRDAFAYQLERKELIFKQYLQSLIIPKQVDISDWNSDSNY